MGVGSFFHKRNGHVTAPDQSNLRNQITFAIRTYLRVRGLQTLLQRETLLVVRKNFDIFVMHGSDGLDDPESVIGLFHLQDAESFAEFEKVHTDPLLRSGELGKMTLGHLADQLAARLTEQLTVSAAKPAANNADSTASNPNEIVLLNMPVTADSK